MLGALAVALAKTEVPRLSAVKVQPDGSVEGLNEIHNDEVQKASVLLVAHLLGLLVAFIGESLTLQILVDVSPDLALFQTIIAGAPGCGKTTLAHQFVFANATPEHPALYFTVLGEPALKMLRYQQQYTFFDLSKLNGSVRFINLSQVLVERGLAGILEEIGKEVKAANPRIVVVDSFRTIMRDTGNREMRDADAALRAEPWHAADQLENNGTPQAATASTSRSSAMWIKRSWRRWF